MRIITIRHSVPDYEKDSLTQKGWHEAELLADKWKRPTLPAFYVYPLGRAQDTASVTLKRLRKQPKKLIIGSGNFTRRYMTKRQKSSAVRGILCHHFSLKRMTLRCEKVGGHRVYEARQSKAGGTEKFLRVLTRYLKRTDTREKINTTRP